MTEEIKIGVGVPTINQFPEFKPYLLKYLTEDFKGLPFLLIDNGNQNIDVELPSCADLIKESRNIGVSASWNKIMDWGFNELNLSHLIILNDDIYLGKNHNQVKGYLRKFNLSFLVGTGTWCAFIISKDVYFKVEDFDENFFPAYYEDNDYFYRMKLSGIDIQHSTFMNPEIYNNSMSIKRNPALNYSFNNNKMYYIRKWGGEPDKETFSTPFNISM